jgi:hypothetical protein
MKGFSVTAAFVVTNLFTSTFAQTWCGKNYKSTEPIVPPGGNFPTLTTSNTPLLSFRCAPAIKPYLAEDVGSPAIMLIDTPVTYTAINGAVGITLPSSGTGTLAVTISSGTTKLGTATVPLNSTKFELSFPLSGLTPNSTPYSISCSATYTTPSGTKQTFQDSTSFSYLPNPTSGSVTKIDFRTGALLAKPADGSGGAYDTVFPVGFYTQYDPYLTGNLSNLDTLKAQGFNTIHPIPPFPDLAQLNTVLDHMQSLGLYLMYDMRWTYSNSTAVAAEVDAVKSRPNLLLWYTADEPDGTSDPLNATATAYNAISQNDGGYHPVSLVLNCQDYQFQAYASGADIIMQDAYMIGNNVTYSTVWGTQCTKDYGDCGCDNCVGTFEDISTRMDEFAQRFEVLGWEREKVAWTVPQAFGNDTYWPRYPTGKEFIVQSVLGINHGSKAVIPWTDPTSDDIKASFSALALSIPTLKKYILAAGAVFQSYSVNRIDVGLWTVGNETLLLATNLNYNAYSLDLSNLPSRLGSSKSVTPVLDSGAEYSGTHITFESVGSGAFILTK